MAHASSPCVLPIVPRLQLRLSSGVLVAVFLAACGSSAPLPSSAVPTLIPEPSGTDAAASMTPTPSPPGPTSASASVDGSAGSAGSVAIDPGLLRVLPHAVGGRAVEEAAAAEASAASDGSLERVARSFAVAYVTSQSKEDWAITSVVALDSSAFGDAEFREWRDTYETSVCASVGGPGGHAQATIAGRTVFIGTCGGLRIYHTLLAGPARVVSVTSAGAADFGEQLVAGLRP